MTLALSHTEQQALHQLLQMAPSTRTPVEDTTAVDFDWASPCSLTGQQVENLNAFVTQLAEPLSKAMSSLVRQEIALSSQPLRQHYLNQLQDKCKDAAIYCIALTDKAGADCGLVRLSAAAASNWVGKILGCTVSGGAQRELSNLEKSLLLDVVVELTKCLAAAIQPPGQELRHSGATTRQPQLNGPASQEYCELSFVQASAAPAPAVPDVSFLLSGALAGNLAGQGQAAPTRAADQMRKDLLQYIEAMPVRGDVWIGHASASMRELMTLHEGDVLLLDKLVDEPVEFTVHGKKVLLGTLAQDAGHYALQVVHRLRAQDQ